MLIQASGYLEIATNIRNVVDACGLVWFLVGNVWVIQELFTFKVANVCDRKSSSFISYHNYYRYQFMCHVYSCIRMLFSHCN